MGYTFRFGRAVLDLEVIGLSTDPEYPSELRALSVAVDTPRARRCDAPSPTTASAAPSAASM